MESLKINVGKNAKKKIKTFGFKIFIKSPFIKTFNLLISYFGALRFFISLSDL